MSGAAPLPLDLRLDGIEGAVSTYLLGEGEPALVDPGPSTTLPDLRSGLRDAGLEVGDVRHLLLTHVHLDHAGAVGHLARENPGLTIHVHVDGAPHLVDPDRLVASTRRTFGEAHDRLWGEVLPVPAERIRPLGELPRPGVPGSRIGGRPGEGSPGGDSGAPGGCVRPVASPGHIAHHVAWLHEPSATLLAGDAMGILLHPDAAVHPPTPPPGVDVSAWLWTLEGLAGLGIDRFGVAHFGLHRDLPLRAAELAAGLSALRIRAAEHLAGREAEGAATEAEGAGTEVEGAGTEEAVRYDEEVRRRQSDHRPREWVDRYFDAFSAGTDWEGMVLHVRRRDEAAG